MNNSALEEKIEAVDMHSKQTYLPPSIKQIKLEILGTPGIGYDGDVQSGS
jgi:hypothetical protein